MNGLENIILTTRRFAKNTLLGVGLVSTLTSCSDYNLHKIQEEPQGPSTPVEDTPQDTGLPTEDNNGPCIWVDNYVVEPEEEEFRDLLFVVDNSEAKTSGCPVVITP